MNNQGTSSLNDSQLMEQLISDTLNSVIESSQGRPSVAAEFAQRALYAKTLILSRMKRATSEELFALERRQLPNEILQSLSQARIWLNKTISQISELTSKTDTSAVSDVNPVTPPQAPDANAQQMPEDF